MSIKTALESEGVDFSEYMNIPEQIGRAHV